MKQSPSTLLKFRNLRAFRNFPFVKQKGNFYFLNNFRLCKSNLLLVGRKTTETETAKLKSLFSRNIASTLRRFYAAAAVTSTVGTEVSVAFLVGTAATMSSLWSG